MKLKTKIEANWKPGITSIVWETHKDMYAHEVSENDIKEDTETYIQEQKSALWWYTWSQIKSVMKNHKREVRYL